MTRFRTWLHGLTHFHRTGHLRGWGYCWDCPWETGNIPKRDGAPYWQSS
jgi:hypothetical protein